MFLHRVGSVVAPLRGLLSAKTCSIPLNQNVASKSPEERVGLPPKPKRPLTPYFRYMQEVRPKVEAENSQLPMVDLIKKIGKQWGAMDDVRKKKYQEEYKKEQVVYHQKMAQYEGKLTDEQKENIQMMKESIAEGKEKRAFRKKLKDLGKPKRPKSAFVYYLLDENKKKPHGDVPYMECVTQTAKKWTGLSDKAKEVYFHTSAAEKKKYEEDMAKWEKQMIKQGHLDVVRQEALIDDRPPKPRKRATKA
uniref:Putative transcription factor a mitochondrial isoform x2 n=1 Tax=Nyssomyia neivai TaxID=330878 RepID=A0A1L8DHZ4_9DIPT